MEGATRRPPVEVLRTPSGCARARVWRPSPTPPSGYFGVWAASAGPGFPRAPALPLPTLPVTHILRPRCFRSRHPPSLPQGPLGVAPSPGVSGETAARGAAGGGEG